MYMPSIFGESLFDNMFPFDEKFFTEKKDPLYGKNVSRLMKTDVRETEKTYSLISIFRDLRKMRSRSN